MPSDRCPLTLGLALTLTLGLASPGLAQNAPEEITWPEIEDVEPTAGELLAAPARPRAPSVYGLFLSGRAALVEGDADEAARRLGAAYGAAPEAAVARDRAFTAAVLAGDLDVLLATRPAAGTSNPTFVEIGRLGVAVQALASGQALGQTHRDFQTSPVGAPHERAGLLVQRWLAAAAGDWDTALAPASSGDRLSQLFGEQDRALLLESRRQYQEAGDILSGLAQNANTGTLFTHVYGEFLERRGRRDEAAALYRAALDTQGEDTVIRRALDRVEARGRPPGVPTPREGAAAGLTTAAAIALAEGSNEFAVAYLRMALVLAPEAGESWIMLGEALDRAGLDEAAREVWSSVPAASGFGADADIRLAWSLSEAERHDEAARVAARALEAKPDSSAAAYTLANALALADQPLAALEVLNRDPLVQQTGDWRVRFLRGAAWSEAGYWQDAETEMQAALELAPDRPEVLNYLGYLWVDRGHRVEEGLAMIERAVAAEPENAAYIDSLGWAHFRLHRYDEAVEHLEAAVLLAPSDPEVNDHLGDAYWQVGREREARFQWERALNLDLPADERAEVERKLAEGLQAGGGAATAGP